MPFIGNQPALSYTSFAKQDFTTSATTSYTLDQPVANENEIALFINFVRQEPTTAYTASGTSLTLTSATSASDDMYCVFLGKAVQTVNPPSGSVGLSQLSATGTKDATTFLRGDNTFAEAGGTNTPNFYVYRSGNQSLSNSTNTKIQFNAETYDTASAFDSTTNYRFTPQTAGKYFLTATYFVGGSTADLTEAKIGIYKNNSSALEYSLDRRTSGNGYNFSMTINGLVEANGSTDYFEVFANATGAGTKNIIGNNYLTFFQGYKIIE